MAESQEWAAPESLQPSSDELRFDLPRGSLEEIFMHLVAEAA